MEESTTHNLQAIVTFDCEASPALMGAMRAKKH